MNRWTWMVPLLTLASPVACIDSDADFDYEDKGFYYGCSKDEDCKGGEGEESYICCRDAVSDPDACAGRCLATCPQQDRLSSHPELCTSNP